MTFEITVSHKCDFISVKWQHQRKNPDGIYSELSSVEEAGYEGEPADTG